MAGLKEQPISHLLHQPIYLPIGQVQALASYWVEEIYGLNQVRGKTLADRLVDAVLHHFFVDAEARKLKSMFDVDIDNTRQRAAEQAAAEISTLLHRLLRDTVGPLMPSMIYRYEVINHDLHITPTLPNLDDYEDRINALSNPDEGWIPPRHRH